MIWRCPNCQKPLSQPQTSQLRCEAGHCFDVAKQGYANLLLANQKKSKAPGDNAEMVVARRRFLEAGHYQFLVDRIHQLIDGASLPEAAFADLGCGEGYYLNQLTAQRAKFESSAYGIDISKEAIKKAASKYKLANFAVASSYNIPLLDESVNIAMSIFAPFSSAEVIRILKNDGKFIRVSPAAEHLNELKARLYPAANQHDIPEPIEGLHLEQRDDIRQLIKLESSQQIQDLLSMTPFNWHGDQEEKSRLIEEEFFQATAHFHLDVMVKRT
ncbi:putative RNA methyltransferase [Teredinibacter sp. KSP-S5-2]|uniref:putative RNA methyltransferase n=1 Tax=Teredinibacter sp. KSP-S5-2 TaxID=3034506 RepID=UPI0029350976|nr:methyltransferase domain-containing protein [Teredinibacter sp. KSP-S5-2]WNO11584.1 methyltransferase domain-containing protein [Teredinibacter sp. KSP-S5-2]